MRTGGCLLETCGRTLTAVQSWVPNAWRYSSTATHTVAACTEAALIFSLTLPMRATRPSRVQTIKLLTHYCEEYPDLRKISGGTWQELYGMNLGPSEVTRPLCGSRSFSFCRRIKRLRTGADSFPQPSTDSATNWQQVAYLSPRRLKHNPHSR